MRIDVLQRSRTSNVPLRLTGGILSRAFWRENWPERGRPCRGRTDPANLAEKPRNRPDGGLTYSESWNPDPDTWARVVHFRLRSSTVLGGNHDRIAPRYSGIGRRCHVPQSLRGRGRFARLARPRLSRNLHVDERQG